MAKEVKKFPRLLSPEEREAVLSFLEKRFGLSPSLFEDYEMLKGASNFWLYPKNAPWDKLKDLNPETVGLLFLREVSHYLKPTSAFLQRFGRWATKNIVEITKEQFNLLKERKKIEEIVLSIEPGYVILKHEGWILGCGLYILNKLFAYIEEKILKSD
jgi:hypothetical protein